MLCVHAGGACSMVERQVRCAKALEGTELWHRSAARAVRGARWSAATLLHLCINLRRAARARGLGCSAALQLGARIRAGRHPWVALYKDPTLLRAASIAAKLNCLSIEPQPPPLPCILSWIRLRAAPLTRAPRRPPRSGTTRGCSHTGPPPARVWAAPRWRPAACTSRRRRHLQTLPLP
jgi:hypothetical protein